MEEIKRYWEKIRGFISENRVDARWILRQQNDDNAYGSLRIVSHPDLQPGYLRAIFNLVTSRRPKTDEEIEASIEEYQMDVIELEIYSVDEHIVTEERIHEAPFQQLQEIFGVDIFE